MFMILRLGLKNIDFLGKMKAEKFALLIHQRTRGGYVPNRERNLHSIKNYLAYVFLRLMWKRNFIFERKHISGIDRRGL